MYVLADTANDTASAAGAWAMMSAVVGTAIVVTIACTVLFVWMFWRVFVKAGFNGALGLLCLIPSIGPLVCLVILAFSTWPNERVTAPPMAAGTMPTT